MNIYIGSGTLEFYISRCAKSKITILTFFNFEFLTVKKILKTFLLGFLSASITACCPMMKKAARDLHRLPVEAWSSW